MPIFSVTVDEGQPAQLPCMCRYTTPSSKRSRVMSPPSMRHRRADSVSRISRMRSSDAAVAARRALAAASSASGFTTGSSGRQVIVQRRHHRVVELVPLARRHPW